MPSKHTLNLGARIEWPHILFCNSPSILKVQARSPGEEPGPCVKLTRYRLRAYKYLYI